KSSETLCKFHRRAIRSPIVLLPAPKGPISTISDFSDCILISFVAEPTVSVQKRGAIVGAGPRACPLSLPRCGWCTNRAGTGTCPYEYFPTLHLNSYKPLFICYELRTAKQDFSPTSCLVP